MPKISIVMPTYNQAAYLKEAVDSIIAQTFTDWELIIVDDGSTDDTPIVLQEYAARDPRIITIRKENGRTGRALNAGFSLARGEYETWFASDNRMYADCLESLYDYLQAHPDVDHVYGSIDYAYVGPDDKVVYTKRLTKILDQTWNKEKFYKHYNLGCAWLWKKSLRLKCGDGQFQVEPCEDYDMAMRMVEAGGVFAFLDKSLAWYRQHSKNLTSNPESHQWYKNVVEKGIRRRSGLPERVQINLGRMKIAIINLEFDCAGVGWNLREAINKFTGHEARHITKSIFEFSSETDFRITHSNLEEFKKILDWADILHFNQWIWTHDFTKNRPFDWTPFNDTPILDIEHYRKTKRIFFHFHAGEIVADPSYWKKECDRIGARMFCCAPPTVQAVLGATWMPNVLDFRNFPKARNTRPEGRISVYSAHGRGDDRKNVTLYERHLGQLKKCGWPIDYEIIWGHKKETAISMRRKFQIALESLTEGYIGMAGWEALALGQVVLARLADITRKYYTDLGNGEEPPIIQIQSPQDATRMICDLFNNPEQLARRMAMGVDWMQNHYNAKEIVKRYINAYKDERT